MDAREIAEAAELTEHQVVAVPLALSPGHLTTTVSRTLGGGLPFVAAMTLTERGRRAVGLWPAEGGVEALVYALERAAEQASTTEQRSRLETAARAVAGVGRDVMVEVLAAATTGRLPGL